MFVQLREINVAYRFVQTGTDALSAPLDISHIVTLECHLQFKSNKCKSNKNNANCLVFLFQRLDIFLYKTISTQGPPFA